ncbi:serine phosphatase RsbU (regulator of sigma subunit)/pSer/pThr/pTyr-binding forkhead associated (FHA) protein [Granulicella aggregans]|uniref:Serine phosphatase RsbU (Regulator of sigma subunit)/pSer/pThr/pTyr-binding forkhead associated (FHA) protein n=1 Tax=Granulicella aggregans TaxID=474949 RepID=A0A7W7ZHC2_9BACT|nr:SpoIIE family protein phosphatase [Granulicella aggregans]MBB5059276.1 serine phosphatase RsbU (regulator of sigma subunit)/pSer/pThr/pTyr-binding forkhead associated (FHA) protein [Granulicella aggregans]
MPESIATANAYLEVVFPDRPTEMVPITELPFFIGRGHENGNHLSIDDMRVSRKSAVIATGASGLVVEDYGQREGVFVNGEPVKVQALVHGDSIRLGSDDGCQIIFRLPPETVAQEEAESKLRSILGSMGDNSAEELNGLKLLLEATSLMHSQLPLESVLAAMIDHAIVITSADRGMLLEPDAAGDLQVKIARGRDGEALVPEEMNPSRSVLGSAIELEAAVVNEDLNLAEMNLQSAQSVVMQLLRSSVVIPLYGTPRRQADHSIAFTRRDLLGAVYLDSKRTATFSALDRQILDALGAQAGSILENARLIERERERQRLEQELSIAREIQQGLLPQGLRDYPHLSIASLHHPCNEVGGDYYDVFPMPDGRLAFLIADVAGKGLGAALVTTMLAGALSGMTLGADPVKVFNHMNQFLCDRAAVARCVTMFLGLIDADGALEFVSAGHPSPLMMRGGTVSELYSTGSLPLGLLEGESYLSTRIQLAPGDTLLLYTDGITEAEDKDRQLFQDERLKQVFSQHQDASLQDLQDGIVRAIEKFTGGTSQSDDVTLLVVRYSDTRGG